MKLHLITLRKILLYNRFYYFIVFFIIFYISLYFIFYNPKEVYKISETEFNLRVTDYKIDGNKLSLNLQGEEMLIGNYYFETEEELKDFKNSISVGDKLFINGTLSKPDNNRIPNTFNYKRYLYYNRINYLLNIESYNLIEENKNIFYKIKDFVIKRIESIKSNEYIYAFVLGETAFIDPEANESYRSNGITHLFALSGLHVSVFSSIILLLFNKTKISEFKKYLIIFIFLMLLCFITSFSPSILRASIFFFLLGINKCFNFNIKSINVLILTLLVLVIINPFIIMNLGFQLSYIITFFLVLSVNRLKNSNKITSIIYVSFIAFLASFPIIVNNFYEMNIIGFINNIFFVPYVSNIVYPFSLTVFVIPKLSIILYYLTFIMEHISMFNESILDFTVYFSKINIFFVVFYYIFLYLYVIKNKKIYFIFIILLILINFFIPNFNTNTYIYYIDVGQGDSTLIITESKKSILIDTGGSLEFFKEDWSIRNKEFSLMKDSIIPYFKSIGLKKIDYLFTTHGDSDHIGEAINLVENFKVEEVFFNCGNFNDLERELIKVLDTKKIPYYSCIKELNINDNKLYFLNNNDYGNENDNSCVIYTELNNYKFLFMGDAGVEVEEELIEKYNLNDIDILKVGHHGSKTSSSENFIEEVNPKYSIILTGKNNRYGHPNKEVLNNLEDSKIYRTDIDGSIMFRIKNDKLEIEMYTP